MKRIRVVCFDLGGVLIRIRHSWDEVLMAMGKEGTSTGKMLAEYSPLAQYQAGELGEDEYLACISRDLNLSLQEARLGHDLILREEYEGATALVKNCLERDYAVYCLSNTNDLHYREFFGGRFPVCQEFAVLIASHRIGFSKPEAEAYAWVENLAKCEPSEVIFFDDSMTNVEAARSRGWLAERVDPADPISEIRACLGKTGLL